MIFKNVMMSLFLGFTFFVNINVYAANSNLNSIDSAAWGTQLVTDSLNTFVHPHPPINLQYTLRTSEWVELTWDVPYGGEARYYNIYRDSDLVGTIDMQYQANGGKQSERVRYERTRTFIDCNKLDTTTNCEEIGRPELGQVYTYTVTAVDDEDEESSVSNSIDIPFEPKVATPKKDGDYVLVFEEQFENTEPETLAENWHFKRLWDQEAWRDVYKNHVNAQQTINEEHSYMVDPTDSEQASIYNPFMATDKGLRIKSEVNNGRLINTGFNLEWNPETNKVEAKDISQEKYTHLSGLLRSKATFVHGYVEARVKVSGVHKFLSTLYLLNSTYFGPTPPLYGEGEIDIMEYLGGAESIYGTPERGKYIYQNYHYRSNLKNGSLHKLPGNRQKNITDSFYSDEYHTYGVLWQPYVAIYFIDDVEVYRVIGAGVTSDPKYLVMSLIAGGSWASYPDEGIGKGPDGPAHLDVDYIKLYQNPNIPGTVYNK